MKSKIKKTSLKMNFTISSSRNKEINTNYVYLNFFAERNLFYIPSSVLEA